MLVDADDEPLDALPDEDVQDSVETETEKGAAESVAQEYRFYESSRLAIGDDEYKIDPDFWSEQFKRDFEIIQERLKMEQEALQAGSLISEPDLTDLETACFPLGASRWFKISFLRAVYLRKQSRYFQGRQVLLRQGARLAEENRWGVESTRLSSRSQGGS